jgi:hypothetical protein
MGGFSFVGDLFGDEIELGIRGEVFGWRGLHSEV